MKKVLLFTLSFLIGIILFVWVLKIVGWQEIKNAMLVFTGWQGLVILLITFLMAVFGTWKWKEILDGKGQKVSFSELWKIYLATFSIRLLAPIIIVGAEIFQGYILKKRETVPWPQGMASVILDRILEWTVNLIVILSGAVFFLFTIGIPPINLFIFTGIILAFFIAAISFFYVKAFKKQSMTKIFGKFLNNGLDNHLFEIEQEIFSFFKPRQKNMWKVFALNVVRSGLMLFRTWLLIFFLGSNIGILPSMSVLGFTYLAMIVPIPTSLGSHEAIQTFAFNCLDLKAAAATAFTMIIRGADLMVALLGIFILFRLGVFLINATVFKKAKKVLSKYDKNQQSN
ncbi:MAG: flippase-like domain-containing protein [Candidatus Nealsonbacteria bacterium]|nr:flippase-like domain-containing protein [Candidatus Nealsonbacteria bacterium]